MTLKHAAQFAMDCQDGCNSSGIARSMVEAMDAIRAVPSNGTRQINQHPIVFLFLYKLSALNGHEPMHLQAEYDIAVAQCEAIVQNEAVIAV